MNKNSGLTQGAIADKTFIDLDNSNFYGEFHLVQFVMRIERNTAHSLCHPVSVTMVASATATKASSSQKVKKAKKSIQTYFLLLNRLER